MTDLGSGQWHYDYALYNRTSDRGVRSFSIPVGATNVTNPEFRDADKDPTTDWAVMLAAGIYLKSHKARVASLVLLDVKTFKAFLYDLGSMGGL